MALATRYRGSFVGQDGTVWRVEILCDGYTGVVASLDFPAKKPLEIEWPVKGKEEVVCGSTATLKVESPGDRTFADLYTIAAGNVALKVWRDNSPWWTGTLDPEFYEEPYERASEYDVTLTFQDFGILDRLIFNLSGTPTLGDVLTDAMTRAQLSWLTVLDAISTTVGGVSGQNVLGTVRVQSSNFFDEDGEAMTLRGAIEGILQPLGLRMVQRGGCIWVYDLHGLATSFGHLSVEWNGKKQTLGVDRVANRVKVTWSPYANTDELTSEECWVKDIDRTATSLRVFATDANGSEYCTYVNTNADDGYASGIGFSLWLNSEGKGASDLANAVNFFKTVKYLSGEDSEGIAMMEPLSNVRLRPTDLDFRLLVGRGFQHDKVYSGDATAPRLLYKGNTGSLQTLFKTSEISLSAVVDPSSLLLKMSVDLLLDVRYNPFEDGDTYLGAVDLQQRIDRWKEYFNFVYIPVCLTFVRADGGGRLFWSRSINLATVSRDGSAYSAGIEESLADTLGTWTETQNAGFLAWYSKTDRASDTGVLGWQKNRQMISPNAWPLDSMFDLVDGGQYIPYPPVSCGGTLVIEVLDCWRAFSTDGTVGGTNGQPKCTYVYPVGESSKKEYVDYVTWALMKLPQVEIVGSNFLDTEVDSDDVEYSGTINADALDDVEIETVCGTARDDRPTARGVYMVGGVPVTQFSRAGRTTSCEELLIGSLHSQWATRHVKLEGDMTENGEGLTAYTEQNQGARKFMKVGEVVDAIGGTTKATLVEVSADEYSRRVTT